jgi:hypothetical protein
LDEKPSDFHFQRRRDPSWCFETRERDQDSLRRESDATILEEGPSAESTKKAAKTVLIALLFLNIPQAFVSRR